MKRYEPGAAAPPGLYWSPGRWDLRVVGSREAVLRGTDGRRYARLPALALPVVALLGAVAGGVYVLVFPVVGAALLLWYGTVALWRALVRAAAGAAARHDAARGARRTM